MAPFRLFSLALALALAALAWGPARADERILNFDSRVTVQPDGGLTVKETITVWGEGREIKRGIIREFPTAYRFGWGLGSRVGFEVKEVLRDGRPEPYRVESSGADKKVRIGKKEVFLQPGAHTFTITYHTDRQLGFFKDYDELYWNVTGNKWTFPIDRARVVVELPPGAKILQSAAYTGPFGAQGQDFRESRDARGNPVFITTRTLSPGEGLTVAVAWPKGLVREPSLGDRLFFLLRDNQSLLVGLVWLLLLLGYYLVVWVRVGKDPAAGVIMPLYTPPSQFSPAATGYLWRLGFDDKVFTSAVVDLAVHGYLRIEEAGGTYTLVEESRKGGSPSPGEMSLLSRLFAGAKVLELKQANHAAIRGAREALSTSLERQMLKVYFLNNWGYLAPGALLTLLGLGGMVLTAPDLGQAAFSILWTSIWTGVTVFLVVAAVKKWRSVLSGGYFRWGNLAGALAASFFTLLFVGGEVMGLIFLSQAISVAAAVVLVGLVILNVLFFHLMKAPTLAGRKILDQIEGFRLFLSVAEQERLNLLNPPAKTPELFEKYLPYALALDVEVAWCEQFADILTAAGAEGQTYSPYWYSGRSFDRFSMSDLGSSLGSSLASAVTSSASPPGSSSGSGGGGFSGGGGGGGGGSGW